MAEAEIETGKQKRRPEHKSKIDWMELGMSFATHAASALVSGFAIAAGGHAFNRLASSKPGLSDHEGNVLNIANRKNG